MLGFASQCRKSNIISGDEVKDAERKVPLSMICSVVINGGMAFIFMIVLLFTLGDLTTAITITAQGGYPIINQLYTATGSKAGTIAIMTMVMFNGTISLFSSLASVSRLAWAFSRDHGLPFSRALCHVSLKSAVCCVITLV
jgi:choline transport protein